MKIPILTHLQNFLPTSILSGRRKSYAPRLTLLGVKFMNTTLDETIAKIRSLVKKHTKTAIYIINVDTLNKAHKQQTLRYTLNKTPFIFPCGDSIKTACNLLNTPVKQNMNTLDIFLALCDMAQKEKLKLFFYGAKEGVAQRVKESIVKKYPKLQIVGAVRGVDIHHNEILNMINHSNADILIVSKDTPRQEEWISIHQHKISAPVVIGVGELFDLYADTIPSSSIQKRKISFEWINRVIKKSKQIQKHSALSHLYFLFRVIRWKREQKKEMLQHYYQIVKVKKYMPLRLKFSYLRHKLYPFSKRLMDITASSIALILLSPLFIIVAALIKMEDGGPVFFSQKRVGRNGKHFNMHKFRSMRTDAEKLKQKLMQHNESKDGVIFKMKEDPRITRIGKFIRKWSIDEFPQLFNILQGDMSLVGPRPPIPSEVEAYMVEDLKRLHIVPGLTCYWQISGRSEIPFREQVELDKAYISKRSLWIDIKIIFATIPAVFTQKGAY